VNDKMRNMSDTRPGAATSTRRLDEILRVDHAGELGAVRIYQGQLAVLRNSPAAGIVRQMADQEQRHKALLDQLLNERGARPSVLDPLWSAAGFALGAASALLGEKAAMACTVAVEDVIGAHYGRQAKEIEASEPTLAAALHQLKDEELEHLKTGLAEGAEKAPAYPLMSGLIKAGCRLAIKIAEKL